MTYTDYASKLMAEFHYKEAALKVVDEIIAGLNDLIKQENLAENENAISHIDWYIDVATSIKNDH